MTLRDMDAVSRDERRMVLFHAVRPPREEGTNLSNRGSRALVLPLLPGIFGIGRSIASQVGWVPKDVSTIRYLRRVPVQQWHQLSRIEGQHRPLLRESVTVLYARARRRLVT